MRIAVIADSHFDQHSRFEECVRVHDWIAQDIAERGVDLVLHSGDVYERKSTPLEREAVARWGQAITLTAPLVVVRGNHDALDDLPLLERLETANPIRVVESAEVVRVAGVQVACLAWPRKAAVLAASAADGKELGEQVAADALRNVLRGLGAQMDEADHEAGEFQPRLLLAHAMVRGSVTSVGQPLVGCDLELGLEDLSLVGADAYLLGHIHMPQAWDISGAPVIYPGSPRRTAFGELESKGYVIVEFDGAGHYVDVQRIETPCTPMKHFDCAWRDGLVLDLAYQDVAGAEVRLRYSVPTDQRESARSAAESLRVALLSAGALSVKLEEQVTTVGRARQPEIAAALTLDDKLSALWGAQKNAPAKDRWPRLLAKVHELEEETHAA